MNLILLFAATAILTSPDLLIVLKRLVIVGITVEMSHGSDTNNQTLVEVEEY